MADDFEPASTIERGEPTGPMDFGDAIRALKDGRRVSRAGWNGKGMWIMLLGCDDTLRVLDVDGGEVGTFAVSDALAMKTAGGDLQPGWLASQADMLATDWGVVG